MINAIEDVNGMSAIGGAGLNSGFPGAHPPGCLQNPHDVFFPAHFEWYKDLVMHSIASNHRATVLAVRSKMMLEKAVALGRRALAGASMERNMIGYAYPPELIGRGSELFTNDRGRGDITGGGGLNSVLAQPGPKDFPLRFDYKATDRRPDADVNPRPAHVDPATGEEDAIADEDPSEMAGMGDKGLYDLLTDRQRLHTGSANAKEFETGEEGLGKFQTWNGEAPPEIGPMGANGMGFQLMKRAPRYSKADAVYEVLGAGGDSLQGEASSGGGASDNIVGG